MSTECITYLENSDSPSTIAIPVHQIQLFQIKSDSIIIRMNTSAENQKDKSVVIPYSDTDNLYKDSKILSYALTEFQEYLISKTLSIEKQQILEKLTNSVNTNLESITERITDTYGSRIEDIYTVTDNQINILSTKVRSLEKSLEQIAKFLDM